MSKRNWKGYRATSFIEALRACKNYALDCHRFSVLTIAGRFGQTEDSLYKWLSNGRMPAILIPAYEVACCCNFVSEFLAASSGRMVIAMPKGKGHKVDAVIESQKKWAMRFLPAAVEELKAESLQRRAKGLLSPAQIDSAAHAFKRLAAGEGFDIQWEAWQNLRHAVGRPYPA